MYYLKLQVWVPRAQPDILLNSRDKFADFKTFLVSPAGNARSEQSSEAIISDISKMLYFFNPNEVDLDSFLDPKNVASYMSEVKATAVKRVCHEKVTLKRDLLNS